MVYAYRYQCPKCSETKTIFTDIKGFKAPLAVRCERGDCDGVGVKKDWDPYEKLPDN